MPPWREAFLSDKSLRFLRLESHPLPIHHLQSYSQCNQQSTWHAMCWLGLNLFTLIRGLYWTAHIYDRDHLGKRRPEMPKVYETKVNVRSCVFKQHWSDFILLDRGWRERLSWFNTICSLQAFSRAPVRDFAAFLFPLSPVCACFVGFGRVFGLFICSVVCLF